jgi:hypothetical protein
MRLWGGAILELTWGGSTFLQLEWLEFLLHSAAFWHDSLCGK